MNHAALAGFIQDRLQAGDDDKTFLIGLHSESAGFAVAAGLRNPADRERFARFARYLLHHRFDCDGHALLMPAEIAGRAVYVVESLGPSQGRVELFDAGAGWRESSLAPGLIGDLRERGQPLPGLLRRELDRLYEAVRVDL